MIVIYLFLISLSHNSLILNIDEIYLFNEYKEKNNTNNFSIILYLNQINDLNNIFAEDIFEIKIESKNFEELTFKCDLYNSTSLMNSFIKCKLKEKLVSNSYNIFYFRKEHFEKSFIVHFEGKIYNFTLKILDHIFYSEMIKNIKTNKHSFEYIFNYKMSYTIITIPIAFSLDNGYFYPTIVSITSILENAFNRTKYEFYILHSPDFLEENKNKIKNFEKKYRCSINFINMTDEFKTATLNKKRITRPAYYRLALPKLLPDINKIIYLDGDTITLIDLKEIYDIDMDNYYYKGFLDYLKDNFNPNNYLYLCSGVLLINLEELRKDDMVNKTYKFMNDNKEKLSKERFHDQPIINALCFRKNGILPAIYGMFNYPNLKKLYKYSKRYRYKYKYSKKELKKAFLNPRIFHYNRRKPWKIKYKSRGRLWWFYAKKSDYYNEIYNKYKHLKRRKKKKNKK